MFIPSTTGKLGAPLRNAILKGLKGGQLPRGGGVVEAIVKEKRATGTSLVTGPVSVTQLKETGKHLEGVRASEWQEKGDETKNIIAGGSSSTYL